MSEKSPIKTRKTEDGVRICFVAPANNYHTKKWATWFSQRGHDVHVISFINDVIPNTTVHFINTGACADSKDTSKLKYLLHAKQIRKAISSINPDIVNVHYATSYGTAFALSRVKPYILSIWGSDVYDFPRKSPLHKAMLKYSLRCATYLFSTSQAMAEEGAKYTDKPFEITPFGVDTELFSPNKRDRVNGDFVIGTVKALSKKYGIEYLLKASSIIRREHPEIPLKVRIAGKGPDEQTLKQLAEELGISNIVTWLGFIPQEQAAKEWANMDVAVVVSSSESESFGVSAVEAQACETAVIISDIPGLKESTYPGKTSVIVPKKDENALAEAILMLYKDEAKRAELGHNGRDFICRNYEYNMCFKKIESLYKKMLLE